MKIFKRFNVNIKQKLEREQKKHKFQKDLADLKNSITQERFAFREKDFWRCLDDANTSGLEGFDMHYVYHTAWAARKLAHTMPKEHVDISSYLYFVNIVSAFVPVKFYDYRPANLNLSNLDSNHADINCLPFENNSIKSLSCMHVVEHVGLGRYGDPVDYDADLKAIKELKRVLAKDSNLFFVVPIGREAKIQFNAHRIYSKEMILEYFANFELIEFAFIRRDGSEGLIIDAPNEIINNESYGCGCFWFKK